jgi:aminoglycoside 6'-N-acetyltransferase I
MANSEVRLATPSDERGLAMMRAALWPETSSEDHAKELAAILGAGNSGGLSNAVFVAQDERKTLIGFVEVGLRSHADGCDPAQPVGFVEGWYVNDERRNQGVGRELMRAAEKWARAKGCREMASDALIENEESQRAHEALGFKVVDRCVHFRKEL